MFPLMIGRWSLSYQGQKPLCGYHDVYQNMVPTLCGTSVPWKFPSICSSGWGLQHKVPVLLIHSPWHSHMWVFHCLVERSAVRTAVRGLTARQGGQRCILARCEHPSRSSQSQHRGPSAIQRNLMQLS